MRHHYSYDTSGNIVSEYKRVMVNGNEKSQTLVRYVRDNSGKAISMIQGPNTYYFVYNGHGDVTSLTDSTGAVVATYSYDEFGNMQSSTGTIYNPLRYSGANNAYYDTETSLYKMGARYYQTDIARWLTRDDYSGEQENPQTQNRYVYVENNPINNSDPSGHLSLPNQFGMGKYWYEATGQGYHGYQVYKTRIKGRMVTELCTKNPHLRMFRVHIVKYKLLYSALFLGIVTTEIQKMSYWIRWGARYPTGQKEYVNAIDSNRIGARKRFFNGRRWERKWHHHKYGWTHKRNEDD